MAVVRYLDINQYFFFFEVILRGFWTNWNFVFSKEKITFMKARSAVLETQRT